jgi:hypothetical protein
MKNIKSTEAFKSSKGGEKQNILRYLEGRENNLLLSFCIDCTDLYIISHVLKS